MYEGLSTLRSKGISNLIVQVKKIHRRLFVIVTILRVLYGMEHDTDHHVEGQAFDFFRLECLPYVYL